MAISPIDLAQREERALRALTTRHLLALRRRARLTGQPFTLISVVDPIWEDVFSALKRDAERYMKPTMSRAYSAAIREVRLPVRRAAVTAYVQEQGPLAAAAYAESLRGETSRAFVQALVRAGFEAPASVRPYIGATPKQAARIASWADKAATEGLSKKAIRQGVERQTEAAIRLRARASADRAIAEAINGARADAWQAQIDKGQLPTTLKKKWRSQGDDRVRPTHRAQARAAAIPWNQPYAILGVMHPPAEYGCRCYEEPVFTGRRRGKAQPRVPPPRTFASP